MTILLTGIDGYLGWPTALKLAKAFPKERIIGVDNYGRRRWVEEIGSVSAIPVASMEERIDKAHELGMTNITFIEGDLVDKEFVYQILGTFKPRLILHLAAQPSAPYSQINGELASYTQENNMQATRNLLWGMKELGLTDSHFVETTTTGVYGAPEFRIPEGNIEVTRDGKKDTIPFPGMGGSWYHMSKCHDANNLLLAFKQWKMNITDVRTAIIYGVETEETRLDPVLANRFDFDFYFGTVVNRFIAMAIAGYPITVYGKGGQKKPMISLEDSCVSLVNLAKNQKKGYEVYNQVEKPFSIIELAEAIQAAAKKAGIKAEINHIPNPRVEKEDHQMEMDNHLFREDLLPEFTTTLEESLEKDIASLVEYKEVMEAHKDRFMK